MSCEVISASGLGKSYAMYAHAGDRLKDMLFGGTRGSEFWALRGMDISVGRGEAVGIIGRNGSGKSTFLQLVCGTLQPSAGTLRVTGRIAAMLELGAGFNPEFTGRENVHLSASIMGLGEKEISRRFGAIAEFAGIGDFMDQPVWKYSSGMYARLAFAVCAHVDADILVVDEVLAVGDVAFQQKCMRFLRDFRERGTLLFVSHDERAVLGLCERAVWLDRGVMRASGPSKEVCQSYATGLAAAVESEAPSEAFRIGGRRPDAGAAPEPPPAVQDSRWHGRNPIEIFDFDPEAPWHGHGGAVIEHVGLFQLNGEALRWTQGGEEIELRIACRAERDLGRPIVGFIFRDRLGQNLFGDNTWLTYSTAPKAIAQGQAFTASFRFQLPYLPTGDYSLAPSVIEGTQQDHIHLHWAEDAVRFRVAESPVPRGAIGVAMKQIRIEPQEQGA